MACPPAATGGRWARRLLLAFAVLALALDAAAGTAAGGLTVVRTGLPHDSLFDLAFAGRHGVAVGDHGVLLESRDGGGTWIVDETVDTPHALLAVAMRDDRLLVVGQSGAVLTRQGDGPWTSRDSGTEERLLNVALADDGAAIAVGGFGQLLRSRDFGESWERVQIDWAEFLDDPGYEPHLYDAAILADGRVLVAGEFGLILLSRDGGDSWEQKNAGDESIFGMTIGDDGLGLAVGQNAYVARTTDGGETWSRVDVPGDGNLLDAWLGPSGRAFVVGIRAMLASTDGGSSWVAPYYPEVARSWYAALASSSPAAEDDGRARLLMAGMLGMILEIPLDPPERSGDQAP